MMIVHRVILVAAVAALAQGCSSAGSQEDLRSTLVTFSRSLAVGDEQALQRIGGNASYRVPLARAVVMWGEVPASEYEQVPAVIRATDLGSEQDPRISAWLYLTRTPTAEDERLIRALGAEATTVHVDLSMITIVRLPLSASQRLDGLADVARLEIDVGPELVPN